MKQFDMSKSVFYERYKPQCVDDLILPPDLKKSLNNYVKTQDVPNLGLFSSSPGCLLPGTTINVVADEKLTTDDDVRKLFSLSHKELTKIRNHLKCERNELLDVNRINSYYLTVAKSSNDSVLDVCMEDHEYTSKFLTCSHWFFKLGNLDEACFETSRLRKLRKYFELDITSPTENSWTSSFNPDNFKRTILSIQMELIYSDVQEITELYPFFDKSLRVDFWTNRGWSEDQAKQKTQDTLLGGIE